MAVSAVGGVEGAVDSVEGVRVVVVHDDHSL